MEKTKEKRFIKIFEIEKRVTLQGGSNKKAKEKIFIPKKLLDKYGESYFEIWNKL